MSRDLILKTVEKNWARGQVSTQAALTATSTVTKLTPTAEEKSRVEKLASLRMRAESGDTGAKKQWRKTLSRVRDLKTRAKRGDARAARACQVLEDSGLFGHTQKISVSGADRLLGEIANLAESSGAAEILGDFVSDEDRLAGEAGSCEREASARVSGALPWGRRRKRRSGARRLRKLAWRASRGDASASARLQSASARLQARANAGDARAQAMLQKVRDVQARAQATSTQQPAATPVYAPPPPVPAPVASATYATPAEESYDEYEGE